MDLHINKKISTLTGKLKNIKIRGKIINIRISESIFVTSRHKPHLYHVEVLETPQIVCTVLWDDGIEASYTAEAFKEFEDGQ